MKARLYPLFPILFLSLIFIGTELYGQDADVVITLDVRAKNLFEDGRIQNKNKIEDQCRVRHVKGGVVSESDFGRVKQHETPVRSNDDVLWEITSLDEGFAVAIDQITPILSGKQKNFFRKLILQGDNGKVKEKVIPLTFSPGSSNKDKAYPYQIFFTITHNGESKSFFVDPKLKGGQ